MSKNTIEKAQKTDNLIYFLFSIAFCMPFAIDYIANGNCKIYMFQIIPLIVIEIVIFVFIYKVVQVIGKMKKTSNYLEDLAGYLVLVSTAYIACVYFAENKNFLNSTVTPIVAAYIGGFITLLGVRLTIEEQQKIREEEKRLSVKPYLFSINKVPNVSTPYVVLSPYYIIVPEGHYPTAIGAEIFIKNTDNGIAIIDKIFTSQHEYLPVHGNTIIDKNEEYWIKIVLHDGDIPSDFHLVIKDVYENRYTYKIENLGMHSTIKEEK